MHRALIPTLLTLLAISSCAPVGSSGTGGGRANVSLDEWGHRPGPRGFRTVIIDAGHGGRDSGAVSPSTRQKEKDAVLDTARRLQRALSGFRTIMVRDNDTFVDLDDRVDFVNRHGGDAILVSIHYNYSPGSSATRGAETYYWRVDSHGLATRIQRAMASVAPAGGSNRGLVRRRLRLTRNPDIPCCLAELGYMSNPSESRAINDPSHRQRLAEAIASAIRAQAARGDAGTGPLPPPLFQPPSRPTDRAE